MNNMVIKIGGSLLYNDELKVNETFLKKFKNWFDKHSTRFDKLVIVVGGGKLSRSVGNSISGLVDPGSVHGVSMQITQANAELLKGYLKDMDIFIPQHINEALEELNRPGHRVVISGGLKAGWSTDMDGAVFADSLKCTEVFKLSNIEGVFDSDPKKNPQAKMLEKLNWKQYYELFDIQEDSTHVPNLSSPVSVEAAIFSNKKNLTFYVSGGSNIDKMDDLSLVFKSGTEIIP